MWVLKKNCLLNAFDKWNIDESGQESECISEYNRPAHSLMWNVKETLQRNRDMGHGETCRQTSGIFEAMDDDGRGNDHCILQYMDLWAQQQKWKGRTQEQLESCVCEFKLSVFVCLLVFLCINSCYCVNPLSLWPSKCHMDQIHSSFCQHHTTPPFSRLIAAQVMSLFNQGFLWSGTALVQTIQKMVIWTLSWCFASHPRGFLSSVVLSLILLSSDRRR